MFRRYWIRFHYEANWTIIHLNDARSPVEAILSDKPLANRYGKVLEQSENVDDGLESGRHLGGRRLARW